MTSRRPPSPNPSTSRHFHGLFEASPDAIFLVDGDTIVDANPAAVKLVRASSKEELLAYSVRDFWPASEGDSHPTIEEWFHQAYDKGFIQYTTRRIRLDGTAFEVEINLSRVDLPEGPILQGVVRDITKQKQAERSRDQLIDVLEVSPDFIQMADREGNIIYQNCGARTLHPGDAETNLADLVPLQTQETRQQFWDDVLSALNRIGFWRGESVFRGADEADIPVLQTIVGHFGEDGDLQRLSSIAQDISPQKRLENELRKQATLDHLTGSYNRTQLYQFINQAIEESRRYETNFSVIMLDIDHFKTINDHFGHQVGDVVLQELVQRLEGALRDTDDIGRWGGEEFMILARQTPLAEAAQLAERLRAAISEQPFSGAGYLTASFGVTGATGEERPETVENRADWALLAAKRHGRNEIRQA